MTNFDKLMISVFHGLENIVEKGENISYWHFLLLLQCFQKATFSGLSGKELTLYYTTNFESGPN